MTFSEEEKEERFIKEYWEKKAFVKIFLPPPLSPNSALKPWTKKNLSLSPSFFNHALFPRTNKNTKGP